MEEILKYFTDLSEEQRRQFSMLDELYHDWNATDYAVGCITVYCGKKPIRLIDHIKYK